LSQYGVNALDKKARELGLDIKTTVEDIFNDTSSWHYFIHGVKRE